MRPSRSRFGVGRAGCFRHHARVTRPTVPTRRPIPRAPFAGPAALLGLIGAAAGYEPVTDVPPDFRMPAPLPLEASVASLTTRPGLRVELVAAEPLVMDPIHLDWGPDGRLWVVEMADYPLGLDGKGRPGGRVRFLEDRDGDGRYETSVLFLEGLNYPTGVKPWRDGVLVIACPEIFFAADRDGDGRADHREVLYRGFREGNQQHRVNGLEWSLDGWLQVANGDSGGTVESVKTGEKRELGGFDLAIHPDSGAMRLLTGRTQYGRVRDDYGHWFGCSNSRPIFHFLLDDELLRRNPHAIYPPGAPDIDAAAESRRVFPLSRGGQRYNDPHAENRFTSACGLAIYRDRRLGPGFAGNAFICEPVHNLVSRRQLAPDGIGFRAVRCPDEAASEFLASTDHWFRPTEARTGPDGALWVVDMHRYVIEHPEWIPEPWQRVLDLRAGQDRGRIYRVVSDACPASMVPERLDRLETPELVARLASDNGWTRDTAHQLLVWRGVKPTDEAVLEASVDNPSPLALIHLLGFFGPGRAPSPILFEALTGDHPTVQQAALRTFRADSAGPGIVEAVIDIARRPPDASTALAAALALGQIETPAAGEALARLLIAHAEDSRFASAAISSVVPHLEETARVLEEAPLERRLALLPNLLETAIGLDRPEAIARLLALPDGDEPAAFAVFSRFLAVLDRRDLDLATLTAKGDPGLTRALQPVERLVARSRELAADASAEPSLRVAAVGLLGRLPGSRDADGERLLSLLGAGTPGGIQAAAASRLIELGSLAKALDRWSSLGPAIRGHLIGGALSDRRDVAVLLTAIESGSLPATAVDAATRERLLSYPQSALRQQAKALFAGATHPDRAAVLSRYAATLDRPGDAARGRTHFAALCAACHRLEGTGRPLGADLSALADKSPPSLLTAILDPNRAVEDKYGLYQVDLKNGQSLAGMIAAEAGETVTLQLLDGTTRDLLRSEIAGLHATGRSAMPEGLEAALDVQGMADLIAFLRDAKS